VAHALVHPWSEPFMRRAAAELILLGLVGAAVGCWTLLHRLAYGAESLAHALFPGLVAAALLDLPLLLGAAGGVVVAAVGIAVVGRSSAIGREASVAVVVTTLFGLGVLLALSRASPPGLDGLLFGDLLGVTPRDLAVSAALAGASLAAVLALHRSLLVVGFDRGSAGAFGARPLFVDSALLVLVAAAILVGVQALGNLLVIAVLLGPPATARLVCRRLPAMMFTAALVAVLGGLGGLYLSYYADVAAGAAVAAVIVGAYLAASLIAACTDRVRSAPISRAPSVS
jgi:ABC-type Mn2+/Zn2+ transport system permease subunit